MQIEKTYHFHASHRNETLKDKCRNLHGHTYHLTCVFDVERDKSNPNISMLFSEFDQIETMIKEQYDHAFIVHVGDPLLGYVIAADRAEGTDQKKLILTRPTSVENVCYELFTMIKNMGFNLIQLRLKETTTSTLNYYLKDWESDKIAFDEGEKWCECVFEGRNNCMVCGRTQWDFKIAKRIRNAKQSAEGTVDDGPERS